jgi:protein-S-isoprenylcysteine O-methyltransferase Ste14
MTPDETPPLVEPQKDTGNLRPPTGPLFAPREARTQTHGGRQLALRASELTILLIAIIGAVALGLGITSYFAEHHYMLAYLIAYAGFRFADLVIRDELHDSPPANELSRRIASQLPLLVMFAGATFERTYIYGGRAPHWSSALGLLLALLGLWLALGARIQLGFLTTNRTDRPVLVQTGLFRYIRHPTFLGVFLLLIGWPLIYGAPISFTLTVIIAWISLRRQILEEESAMLTTFGEEYDLYIRKTDALIPNIW